jgi:hypothetical protein
VLGMNPGDSETATIPVDQASAAHRPEMVIEVDRQHLPPTLQPYAGQRLQMTQQDGTSDPVLVMAVTDAHVTLDANHPLAVNDLIPLPALQATPTGLPYPILRCLASTSQSRAAPCSAWLRGAPAGGRGGRGARQAPRARMATGGGGWQGGRGQKGRLDFLYVGQRASASDRSRFRQLSSLWGLCPAMGEFVLGFAATVTGCSTEPHGRGPPKLGHSCGNFSV